MKTFRKYLKYLPILIVCQCLAVIAFNWYVDPYGVWHPESVTQGINKVKPAQNQQVRLFKARDIVRLQPKTVFLGSSKAEFGLDPSHPALQNNQPVYNLALTGANMHETKRYLEHAYAMQPELQLVILGIDLFMFDSIGQNRPNFRDARLENKSMVFPDILNVLFSLDATEDSIKTIQDNQENPDAVGFFHENGSRDAEYYRNHVYRHLSTREFWKRSLQNNRFFQTKDRYKSFEVADSFIQDFQDFVKFCKDNNIELKVFIAPSHATYWESIWVSRIWPFFKQWKRDIVQITPFWDFSGYNSITTEPVNDSMQNFIESVHYTKKVGNLILNRLLDFHEEKVPDDFGVWVTPENIESHLARIRRNRQSWVESHPETAQLVRSLKP